MSVLLGPPPRQLRRPGGSLRLAAAAIAAADGNPAYQPAAARLEAGLRAAGVAVRRAEPGPAPSEGETVIKLLLAPPAAGPGGPLARQGYRLEVGPGGVELAAAAEPGLYHGAETLLQWLSGHSPAAPGEAVELPAVEIADRPGFAHRGLLLDVSRNRVPTMAELLRLIDQMAALKLNQLQLYTEHTFAYRGHELVWRGASPLTAAEVRELDAYCRARAIELVPNQNSFGHLHRWLKHPPYRPLAEVPEGLPHPFSDEPEPFSLCPVDPGSVELLRDLYGQLLPQFTSHRFNVGCDETLDLGKGRSAEACRERGAGRVYLDFLRRLHALAAEHGRRIQFWGDILAGRPELLPGVPADATVLEWGYEAGHPFAERAAVLAGAGLEFYLCPGTSSWNSLGGRLENAVANLAEAALAGAEHGASGYLITDWGDHGHLQPPPISWPPLVAGATFAWSPESAAEPERLALADLVDRHIGGGLAAGTGAVLAELGNAYRAAGVRPKNVSALFKLLLFAHRDLDEAGLGALTTTDLARAEARVEAAGDRLGGLAAGGQGEALVRRELAWVTGMLRLACRLGSARLAAGGALAGVPRRERRRLAKRLGRRIEELGPLWLARSRPGGLEDSRARLERVRRLLA